MTSTEFKAFENGWDNVRSTRSRASGKNNLPDEHHNEAEDVDTVANAR